LRLHHRRGWIVPGRPSIGAALTWGPMFVYNLDHVALAVRDLDDALADYKRLFGAEPLYREVVEEQGVEEAMIAVGGSFIQLLQPVGDDTPVGRFLANRGEGMHHIALAVSDIDAALDHLKAEGARLVDEEPRTGGRGARIAFVHPKAFAGTLVELVEVHS
jgi:methylmalonyl-CoA/ethylmalonyl-CoA epimerase